jgi:hypothetical protein
MDPERLAFLIAHVEHFHADDPIEVARRLGHPAVDFERAATEIPLALAKSSASGDMGPAQRFAEVLASTREDLERRQPRLAELGEFVPADETLAMPAPAATRPLPFRDPRPGDRPPAPLPPPPHAQSSETVGLATSYEPGSATPFEPRRFEAWTVEMYAAFAADRRVMPVEDVRRKHGIAGPAEEQALIVHFSRRFGDDPALKRQWDALVEARSRRGR